MYYKSENLPELQRYVLSFIQNILRPSNFSNAFSEFAITNSKAGESIDQFEKHLAADLPNEALLSQLISFSKANSGIQLLSLEYGIRLPQFFAILQEIDPLSSFSLQNVIKQLYKFSNEPEKEVYEPFFLQKETREITATYFSSDTVLEHVIEFKNRFLVCEAFYWACNYGHNEILMEMLNLFHPVKDTHFFLLGCAFEANNKPAVGLLLQSLGNKHNCTLANHAVLDHIHKYRLTNIFSSLVANQLLDIDKIKYIFTSICNKYASSNIKLPKMLKGILSNPHCISVLDIDFLQQLYDETKIDLLLKGINSIKDEMHFKKIIPFLANRMTFFGGGIPDDIYGVIAEKYYALRPSNS